MKKVVLGLSFIFTGLLVQAQQGLEKIIVEKYYISDSKDSAASGGSLPVGSVTYRIYADMLPKYRFQAAYGVTGHEIRIATTTTFYNNEEYGATTANAISNGNLKNGIVMLDSWVSVCAGAQSYYGVLKIDDDGVKTIVNADSLLRNTNADAGIPIKIQDGLIAASPQSATTLFMLDSAISVFGNRKGSIFSTYNGSWASFGGSIGYKPADNMVLIAQITTDGVFSFELNLQLGTPYGGTENYVARNPAPGEIQLPSLIYPLAPVKAAPKHK